jgi:D-serine deaminase-like pyridoxal phosphate-dependent protein
MRELGYENLEVSGGSTPTGLFVAKSGGVDEIRPGTYIFNDYMLWKENAAELSQVAARIYATVVSVPADDYAVLDGGTKTFPMDIMLDQAPYYYNSYAMIVGREDLELRRMNEEHGIVKSTKGKVDLQVGQVLELMPIHVCTAVNMQNNVYIYDGETLRKEKVAGRGMLF